MAPSRESKEQRKQRLLGLLRSGGHQTCAKLSLELGVSSRTLMRDLEELREQGYPVETERGRGGGVQMVDRWGIDRLHLNHLEVLNMLVALALAERLKSPILGTELRSIRQKIARSFPQSQRRKVNQLRRRILTGQPASANITECHGEVSPEVAKVMSTSFFELRPVEITYLNSKGEASTRVVEPHYLLLTWPAWYVLTWDRLREGTRVFRFDRIASARALPENFRLKKERFFEEAAGYFQTV